MKPALTALFAAAMLAATACSGQSTSSSSATTQPSSDAASPTTESAASSAPVVAAAHGSNGASVFSDNCSSCHQSDGQGQSGVFPPLVKNAVVTGDPSKVIHIVRYGLTGAIKINGVTYNGTMPAWNGQLSNADVAAVISFIRSSWGNKASAVTQAQVAAVKK